MDRTRTSCVAKLSKLRSQIKQQTFGILTDVSVGLFEQKMVVKASSATHYGVQLARAIVRDFIVNTPELAPVRLEFNVKGRPLVLHETFARFLPTTPKNLHRDSSWDKAIGYNTRQPESLFLRNSFPRPDKQRRERNTNLSHSLS